MKDARVHGAEDRGNRNDLLLSDPTQYAGSLPRCLECSETFRRNLQKKSWKLRTSGASVAALN